MDLDTKQKLHRKFNLPQIIDHYHYYKSDFYQKMHAENGELLQVKDLPENLGFNDFMPETITHNYSDRTSQSFLVPFKDIAANDWDLSINRYKEIVYEEVEYDAPNVILGRIGNLNLERETIMSKLKEII